jgi:hypothetical protein
MKPSNLLRLLGGVSVALIPRDQADALGIPVAVIPCPECHRRDGKHNSRCPLSLLSDQQPSSGTDETE